MTITWPQLASSAIGYMSDGFAVAAFIPSVLSAAAWREVDLTPSFLMVWTTAGTLNLISQILSGNQFSQLLLQAWYETTNVVMIVQLFMFGSDKPLSPVKWKGPRNQHIVNSRKGWWGKMWTELEYFSPTAVLKLCAFVQCFMLALFGITTVLNLHSNPDWTVPVVTEIDLIPFIIGWVGVSSFIAARLVQLVTGWMDHFAGKEPEPSRVNIIFYLLYGENVLQGISIIILDPTNQDYLKTQSVWLCGAWVPCLLDPLVLLSKWHHLRKHRNNASLRERIIEEEQNAAVEDRLENLQQIARLKFRYRMLLDLNKPAKSASPAEKAAYQHKIEQINLAKDDLIHSPAANAEKEFAHSHARGPQFGPLDQFIGRIVAPFGTSAETLSGSSSTHARRSPRPEMVQVGKNLLFSSATTTGTRHFSSPEHNSSHSDRNQTANDHSSSTHRRPTRSRTKPTQDAHVNHREPHSSERSDDDNDQILFRGRRAPPAPADERHSTDEDSDDGGALLGQPSLSQHPLSVQSTGSSLHWTHRANSLRHGQPARR